MGWQASCATELRISIDKVVETANLLSDDNTLPFIVRYRGDITGGLDESQVRAVFRALTANNELEARRQTVLKQLVKASVKSEIIEAVKAAADIHTIEDVVPFLFLSRSP